MRAPVHAHMRVNVAKRERQKERLLQVQINTQISYLVFGFVVVAVVAFIAVFVDIEDTVLLLLFDDDDDNVFFTYLFIFCCCH